MPSSSSEEVRYAEREEIIEHLSAQLALIETASIALQQFEEQPEIGAIYASLEHAVGTLAGAHERIEHYLRRAGPWAHELTGQPRPTQRGPLACERAELHFCEAEAGAELLRLHRTGDIDDHTLHELEHDLDIEELGVTSAKAT